MSEPDMVDDALLRIWVLGRFHVAVGGRDVPAAAWRRRKAAALIKLLAIRKQHRLHRDEIVDAFWPDGHPIGGASAFHNTLYTARRILEPELPPRQPSRYLNLDGDAVVLGPAPCWVDSATFLSRTATATASGNLTLGSDALDLYTGDLLPDDLYEDWTLEPRETLRSRLLHLLLDLATRHEEIGQLDRAIDFLRRAVAVEPTAEEIHSALIRLYLAAGQRGAAEIQYRELSAILHRELGTEPEPATRDLISRGALLPASGAARPETPVRPESSSSYLSQTGSRFIGRERELADLTELVRSNRLLSLVGTSGVGKTRLALELAHRIGPDFSGGAWLVELAAVTDPALVPVAALAACGLRAEPDRLPLETLEAFLRSRPALLIVDNCEHVLAASARMIAGLLQTCPELRVVATSRIPLKIPDEYAWRTPTMMLPPDVDEAIDRAQASDAVRLFIERASAYNPSRSFGPSQLVTIARICRRVEGLPLAIDLAAARTRNLTLAQISSLLDDSLSLLAGDAGSHLPRHKTMRIVLDWSFGLLPDVERRLFGRLSVFSGGFTLEAASAVTQANVLEPLSVLVDHSLVTWSEEDNRARYHLLEPVRQYAAERLRDAGNEDGTRRAHLKWCVDLTEETAAQLDGSERALAFERLEAEMGNIRAALKFAIEGGEIESGLRIAGTVYPFWSARNYLAEGREWLETLVGSSAVENGQPTPPVPAPVVARALTGAGVLAAAQGDGTSAKARHQERLRLSRRIGDEPGIGRALHDLADVAYAQGDRRSSIALLVDALAVWRLVGEKRAIANATGGLGTVCRELGLGDRAQACADESLRLYQEAGDSQGAAEALLLRSTIAMDRGEYTRATLYSEESLVIARQIDSPWTIARTLNVLAEIELAVGNESVAGVFCQDGMELARRHGDRPAMAHLARNAGLAALARGQTTDAQRFLAESLSWARRVSDRWGIALAYSSLGTVNQEREERERAVACFHEALAHFEASEARIGLPDALESLAACLLPDEPRRAAELAGVAAQARLALQMPVPPSRQDAVARMQAAVRRGIGARAAAAAFTAGQQMTLSQVFADIRSRDAAIESAPLAGHRLSRREREIADLVAQGVTNRVIAQRLGIADRTADAHVRSILRKLNLNSRSQVASVLQI